MNWVALFPVLMMLETAAASLIYFVSGDWRGGLYWAAATVITFAVTI